MRLTVELDGRPTVVELADDLESVRVGGQSHPVRIVARGPARVDLEIAGESVVVVGWPEHNPAPTGPVDVNGERWKVGLRVETAGSGPAAGPSPVRGAAAGTESPAPPSLPGTEVAGAIPILPPMPGRVVELRVHDGESVTKGAVLLVLEAMKMRNEVVAPSDGVVRDVRVREGANVRARETMLVVAPK